MTNLRKQHADCLTDNRSLKKELKDAKEVIKNQTDEIKRINADSLERHFQLKSIIMHQNETLDKMTQQRARLEAKIKNLQSDIEKLRRSEET